MKQALYLETSVIGAYLDNGEPFRRDLTIRWWEHEMPDYRTVISPLVTSELTRVQEPHRTSYLKLIRDISSRIECSTSKNFGRRYILQVTFSVASDTRNSGVTIIGT